MRKKFRTIPVPLQKQVLIRLGFGMIFLILFFMLLFMTSEFYSSLSCIAISVFCIANACLLLKRSLQGEYVMITGVCTEQVVTPLRRRTKYITVRTDAYILRIMIMQRLKRIPVGSVLAIYVANTTPVYERDGVHQFHTYLAMQIDGMSNAIEKKE